MQALVAALGAEDHLAFEARRRSSAAAAAIAAAFFTFVGVVWRSLTLADLPRNGLLDSLGRLSDPGAIGVEQSLRIDSFTYYDDQATSVLAASVLVAIGYVALGLALTYLAAATRARRREFASVFVYLPLVAGVLQALATVLSAYATNSAISDFLDGKRTVDDASDVATSGLAVFASLLGLPGALGLAFALVFVALNAMRVGLLTRFMGVLGMITGALQILPFGGPLPVVQCFWLILLGLLFLGRYPGGAPPAWRTGKAEPWPTQAQVREQRARAAAEARGEEFEAPEPVAAGPERGRANPNPNARRRKRKRR